MLISSFLSYLVGYIGPFVFCGKLLLVNFAGAIFLIATIFQDKLLKFVPSERELESKRKEANP